MNLLPMRTAGAVSALALALLLPLIFCLAPFAKAGPGSAGATQAPEAARQEPAGQLDADLVYRLLKASYPKGVVGERVVTNGTECALVNGSPVPLAGLGLKGRKEALDVAGTLAGGVYPLEPDRPKPQPGVMPGRVHCYALMNALYGEISRKAEGIVKVDFFGSAVPFASHAGAASSLRAVARDLEKLHKANPGFSLARWSTAGDNTGWFPSRASAGSAPSIHSYGIAVDFSPNVDAALKDGAARCEGGGAEQETLPAGIVAAFERHGFIWSGKWHEYDALHFEYRPEVINYARHLQGKPLIAPPAE